MGANRNPLFAPLAFIRGWVFLCSEGLPSNLEETPMAANRVPFIRVH